MKTKTTLLLLVLTFWGGLMGACFAQCPSVTLSQTNVMCNGGSNGTATASVTGGTAPYAYSWSTTPVQTTATATGLTAGTYIVNVNDATPCPVIINTVTITEPATLTVNMTSVNASSCSANDGSATASATGGTLPYVYSWSTTPSQTTATATGLAPSLYIVTVRDANACNINDSASVSCLSGISSAYEQYPAIKVYPNPASGFFYLQINSFAGAQMKIYNVLGKCVYQQAGTLSRQQIDLSSHPDGIYFLSVTTAATSVTQKLIIQR